MTNTKGIDTKCCILLTLLLFLWFLINKRVNSKKQVLFPKHLKILQSLGENIKLARKRRSLTTIQVSERAGIDRTTLYLIEKGTPSVSMGAYFNVLRVLGLQNDFLKLASDDKQGRDIQDLKLLGGK
jgi:DNA-binding XRE family transcriptional regulator